MNKQCKSCGKPFEYMYSIYSKCDSCIGARTKKQIQELSVEDKVKLRFTIRRERSRLDREFGNLLEQCNHPKITRRHLVYDTWKDEVYEDNHHLHDENSFVWCEVCGNEFGWECLSNPKGYCEYPSDLKEEGIYNCNILHCVHCKKPKDRWRDIQELKKKVEYIRPPDEIVDGDKVIIT